MYRPPALSVLILPEDGANQSHATLAALAKKVFLLIDPNTNTAKDRLRFEPVEPQYERWVHGAYWKTKLKDAKQHKEFAALISYIAGKISEDNGFVLVHVDGDLTYSSRDGESAKTKNIYRFRELIEPKVRMRLGIAQKKPDEIERFMKRILFFVPYYSLEAWLYQNTSVGKQICTDEHRGAHHGDFHEWEADRGLLDEIEKVKDRSCLRGNFNKKLAESAFPAQVAFDVGKSFADAVNNAKSSAELRAALSQTYATPSAGRS